MSLIRVQNLHYTYQANTPFASQALRGVDLTVEKGDFRGIIGPVGSGKSTLIQHINGLIRPPAGTVWVDGQDVGAKHADLRAVRRQVGLLFQYPEHQLFADTVFADVAFGPRNLGLSPQEVEARVREAMAAVELPYQELGDRSPFSLSGGQKRRAALAGVLAMDPRVLILDEPAAGLDPEGRAELLDLIARLREEGGRTVILVSHHMDDVARLAEKVVVLHQGRVFLDGSTREVFAQGQALRKIGLAVPAVTDLLEQLAARGLSVRTDCLTVAEASHTILGALQARTGGGSVHGP